MNETSKAGPLVWTVAETAALLSMSKAAVYRAIEQRYLPSIQIGGRMLVPKDRLAAFMAGDLAGLREPPKVSRKRRSTYAAD